MELTQSLVKSIFGYREDGNLIWKVSRCWKAPIGNIVGSFSPTVGSHTLKLYGKCYLLSRIIFLWHKGYLPEMVDHENRITTDDRIENLRAATPSQNAANRTPWVNKTSIFLGVSFNKSHNGWVATIGLKGKTKYIGSFKCQKNAALAYNREAVRHHKEFANLNIIQP